jgi:hypothetical protein
MSYNRWLYAYAEPIINVDPSGFETDRQLFADFKDDYDNKHKNAIRWTSQEKSIVLQALGAIAAAYAKAYNSEAEKRGSIVICSSDTDYGLYGFELYIDPTTTKIDPFTAFNRIHNIGQRLVIYKHSSSYANSGIWGTGNSHTVNIWSAGYFDNNINYLTGYGQVGLSVAMDNYKRFVTHEMGHVFDNIVIERLNKYPRSLVTGNLAQGSFHDANGFCAPKIEWSNGPNRLKEGWQWRTTNDSWEYFADMFVGWTYNCWEHEVPGNEFSPLTDIGQERSNFMNEHMPVWVYSLINLPGEVAPIPIEQTP